MPILEDIKQKIIERIQKVLDEGFGEIVIKIQDHRVVHISRTHAEKI